MRKEKKILLASLAPPVLREQMWPACDYQTTPLACDDAVMEEHLDVWRGKQGFIAETAAEGRCVRIGVHVSIVAEMGGDDLAESLCEWMRVVHRPPFVVFELSADEKSKDDMNFLRILRPRFTSGDSVVSLGGTMACSSLRSSDALNVQELLLDALSVLCLHTHGIQLHPDMHCALPYRDYTHAEAVGAHARAVYDRACLQYHTKLRNGAE